MKGIFLSQGQAAIVDDSDYEALNAHKWSVLKQSNTFYAVRQAPIDGKQIIALMHCVIMGSKGVDHRDGDGLNNQRSNLRFATSSQNNMNQQKRENTSSVYKGVTFDKRANKWKAQIGINGKLIYLGLFDAEVDAAKAYNAKAIELFCEFANLNNV